MDRHAHTSEDDAPSHDQTTPGASIATERSPFGREDPSRASRSRAKIKGMRPRIWLILIVQAALVSLVVIAVASRRVPLGVPGEWEWLRVEVSAGVAVVVPGGPGRGRYAGFVAIGLQGTRRPVITPGRSGVADRAPGRGDRRPGDHPLRGGSRI